MNENELKELFERRNISEIRHAVDNHREIKERVLAWAVEHGNTELVHYVMNAQRRRSMSGLRILRLRVHVFAETTAW